MSVSTKSINKFSFCLENFLRDLNLSNFQIKLNFFKSLSFFTYQDFHFKCFIEFEWSLVDHSRSHFHDEVSVTTVWNLIEMCVLCCFFILISLWPCEVGFAFSLIVRVWRKFTRLFLMLFYVARELLEQWTLTKPSKFPFPNRQNFPYQTVKIFLSKPSKFSFPNRQYFPFKTVKISNSPTSQPGVPHKNKNNL